MACCKYKCDDKYPPVADVDRRRSPYNYYNRQVFDVSWLLGTLYMDPNPSMPMAAIGEINYAACYVNLQESTGSDKTIVLENDRML